MKIKIFERNGHIDQEAIFAGVYQFKIGVLGDNEDEYLSLYIGESYSMLLRCSEHLYEVFHTNPLHFGLTKNDLENEKLQMIVDIYKRVPLSNGISNSDRDLLLCKEELFAIKEMKPLSQNVSNDNLRENYVEVVQKAIEILLSKR